MHIRDSAGNVYNVVAVPSSKGQFSGVIRPYTSLREEVGFEVARGADELFLYINPGMNGRQMIVVDLQEQGWHTLLKS